MLQSQVSAREIRRRLMNPPNGRISSELEIVCGNPAPVKDAAVLEIERLASINLQARQILIRLIEETARDITVAIGGEFRELPWDDKRPKVRFIIHQVCRHYDLERCDLISARRTKNVTWPRHVASYLARTLTGKSLPEIGRELGGRDHTTILNSIQQVQRRLADDDQQLVADIAAIKLALAGGQAFRPISIHPNQE